MIIDHNDETYKRKRQMSGLNKYNGAYYYSKEIVERIIPNVKTDRNWITINVGRKGCDNAIVFIHNNKRPELYNHLRKYKNLILVCGIRETKDKVKHLGTPIYLPLSVNVAEVEQYKCKKTKDIAFVGRKPKRKGISFPQGTDFIEGLPRDELLKEMAKFREVFCVGRTAIEAKILGCKVLPYDPRFPNPSMWKVLDNLDASKILQKELDRIDGGKYDIDIDSDADNSRLHSTMGLRGVEEKKK